MVKILSEIKRTSEEEKRAVVKVPLKLLLPLKEQFRHMQPFDTQLPSNIITAVILSYVGRKKTVYHLMQILNHKGRAYII